MSQPNKLIIYETAMCCSSGICGPSPDQTLIGLQDTIDRIRKTDTIVERYSITQNPKKFMENPQIIKLIQEQQLKALPITLFNGNVMKVGSYPTKEELQALVQSEIKTNESPEAQTNTVIAEGCCADKNYCDIRCKPTANSSCCGDSESDCC